MHSQTKQSTYASDIPQICLARQPILDKDCNLVAYELLFRNPGETSAHITDNSLATISVITNAFSNIGTQSVLGDKIAYINFDTELLKHNLIDILPSDKVVLEILEDVAADDELLSHITALRQKGYHFALDDFVMSNNNADLIDFADTIKVDITLLDQNGLVEHVNFARQHGKKLLAEKVETNNEFELCRSLGFDYFQGYFFSKPAILKQAEIPSSKLQVMQLMNQTMDEGDSSKLEQLLSHDLSISFKLLKYINSAGFFRGREINSLSEALSMLGREPLYRWLSFLLFTSSEADKNPSRTKALFNTAVYRGRFMELMAQLTNHHKPSDLFIVGTFSYLEALLNCEIGHILRDMSLPVSIREALVNQTGEYWPYLSIATASSDGDLVTQVSVSEQLGLTLDSVMQAQLSASSYSESLSL